MGQDKQDRKRQDAQDNKFGILHILARAILFILFCFFHRTCDQAIEWIRIIRIASGLRTHPFLNCCFRFDLPRFTPISFPHFLPTSCEQPFESLCISFITFWILVCYDVCLGSSKTLELGGFEQFSHNFPQRLPNLFFRVLNPLSRKYFRRNQSCSKRGVF